MTALAIVKYQSSRPQQEQQVIAVCFHDFTPQRHRVIGVLKDHDSAHNALQSAGYFRFQHTPRYLIPREYTVAHPDDKGKAIVDLQVPRSPLPAESWVAGVQAMTELQVGREVMAFFEGMEFRRFGGCE